MGSGVSVSRLVAKRAEITLSVIEKVLSMPRSYVYVDKHQAPDDRHIHLFRSDELLESENESVHGSSDQDQRLEVAPLLGILAVLDASPKPVAKLIVVIYISCFVPICGCDLLGFYSGGPFCCRKTLRVSSKVSTGEQRVVGLSLTHPKSM